MRKDELFTKTLERFEFEVQSAISMDAIMSMTDAEAESYCDYMAHMFVTRLRARVFGERIKSISAVVPDGRVSFLIHALVPKRWQKFFHPKTRIINIEAFALYPDLKPIGDHKSYLYITGLPKVQCLEEPYSHGTGG